jgi:hypothetical protein
MNVQAETAAARAQVINDDENEETEEEDEENDDDEEEDEDDDDDDDNDDDDDDEDEDAYEIPDIPVVEEQEQQSTSPGELISYDWLPTENEKYRWKTWLNGSMFKQLSRDYEHLNDPVEVCPNMIVLDRKMNQSDVNNRLAYKNWYNNNDNYNACEQELSSYRKGISDTIKIIVSNFILDIARKLHFGEDENGNELKSWDDFLQTVERTTQKSSCKKILIAAYLIFDWMPHYQKKVGRYVKKIHNIVIVPKAGVRTTRRTQDFIYKMVSAQVNDLRRKINKYASESIGFKYTIMRYDEHLDKKAHHNDNRRKKHFYDWMIQYNPVSYF